MYTAGFIVHCSAHCTLYSVIAHTMYIVQRIGMYTVQCTLYVYSIHYTVYNIHSYTLYNIHSVGDEIHSTQCSVQYRRQAIVVPQLYIVDCSLWK